MFIKAQEVSDQKIVRLGIGHCGTMIAHKGSR